MGTGALGCPVERSSAAGGGHRNSGLDINFWQRNPGNKTMDHPDPVNTPSAASSPAKAQAKDPVCGMDANPPTARFKTSHNGKEYFFCSAGCLAKFQANPEKILSSPPKPMTMTMTSGLVSPGGPTAAPTPIMPTLSKPAAAPVAQLPAASGKDTRVYVCPM